MKYEISKKKKRKRRRWEGKKMKYDKGLRKKS